MEHKTKISTARPSLLLLHEYCHLEIVEFLKLEDTINLANSCSRLRSMVDRTVKKRRTILLDWRTLNKGDEYVFEVFSYIGQHLSSFKLDCDGVHVSLTRILRKISEDCKNLKCLIIDNWHGEASQGVPPMYNFDNVELLTLRRFKFDFTKNFHLNFTKLKSFNILFCSIELKDLKTVLQNNPNMESFVFSHGSDFDCKLFKLIPNINRLSLMNYEISLENLDRLTKLHLYCRGYNINHLLRELANRGIMEEMELIRVITGYSFFNILASFDKLQMLVITSKAIGFDIFQSSINWPKNLKRLRLELTGINSIEMIQQLESIEQIDLMYCTYHCTIALDDGQYFNPVAKFSRFDKFVDQIHRIIYHSNRKQRLEMILPDCVIPAGEYRSQDYLIDSECLRILYCPDKSNPLGIKIQFPGV